MVIASIFAFAIALYVSLVDLVNLIAWIGRAIVHGKDLIATGRSRGPVNTVDIIVLVVLWTIFYVLRVYA